MERYYEPAVDMIEKEFSYAIDKNEAPMIIPRRFCVNVFFNNEHINQEVFSKIKEKIELLYDVDVYVIDFRNECSFVFYPEEMMRIQGQYGRHYDQDDLIPELDN
jgi:hypothetical protein